MSYGLEELGIGGLFGGFGGGFGRGFGGGCDLLFPLLFLTGLGGGHHHHRHHGHGCRCHPRRCCRRRYY